MKFDVDCNNFEKIRIIHNDFVVIILFDLKSQNVSSFWNMVRKYKNVDQMQDLAKAFIKVLGNEKASKQVYNISGDRYVTFDGLARACAKVINFPYNYRNLKSKNLYHKVVFTPCRRVDSLSPRLFTTILRSLISGKRKHFHSETR